MWAIKTASWIQSHASNDDEHDNEGNNCDQCKNKNIRNNKTNNYWLIFTICMNKVYETNICWLKSTTLLSTCKNCANSIRRCK